MTYEQYKREEKKLEAIRDEILEKINAIAKEKVAERTQLIESGDMKKAIEKMHETDGIYEVRQAIHELHNEKHLALFSKAIKKPETAERLAQEMLEETDAMVGKTNEIIEEINL